MYNKIRHPKCEKYYTTCLIQLNVDVYHNQFAKIQTLIQIKHSQSSVNNELNILILIHIDQK